MDDPCLSMHPASMPRLATPVSTFLLAAYRLHSCPLHLSCLDIFQSTCVAFLGHYEWPQHVTVTERRRSPILVLSFMLNSLLGCAQISFVGISIITPRDHCVFKEQGGNHRVAEYIAYSWLRAIAVPKLPNIEFGLS